MPCAAFADGTARSLWRSFKVADIVVCFDFGPLASSIYTATSFAAPFAEARSRARAGPAGHQLLCGGLISR